MDSNEFGTHFILKIDNILISVKYAAGRIDTEVKFTDDACEMLVKVPRTFLNTVLKGCVKWAKEKK